MEKSTSRESTQWCGQVSELWENFPQEEPGISLNERRRNRADGMVWLTMAGLQHSKLSKECKEKEHGWSEQGSTAAEEDPWADTSLAGKPWALAHCILGGQFAVRAFEGEDCGSWEVSWLP